MKNMKKEILLVLTGAAVFITALAVPVYVYLKTVSATRYVREVESSIGDARSRETMARAAKQMLSDTAEAREVVAAAALPFDGAATFIALLEQDARDAGIAFSIGAVSVDPKDGPFDALSVSMRASGTFAAVMRSLSLVETSQYLTSVEDVSFERDEKGNWNSTMNVSAIMQKKP